MRVFYGEGLPYIDGSDLSGKLIVIEGADKVGRSTQIEGIDGDGKLTGIEGLTKWLEVKGYGVVNTGWTRSPLLGPAIDAVKRGNTLNQITFSVLYAADFADRFENVIIPALKGGFIVLADRYMYTAFARHTVRGVDPQWIRKVYSFALTPDLVIYLKIGIEDLIMRTFSTGSGMKYWEAGMDIGFPGSVYDSFVQYQTRILEEFDKMTDEFGFKVVDASRGVKQVNRDLKRVIEKFLETNKGSGSSSSTQVSQRRHTSELELKVMQNVE
jgi:dTMP kinase